MRRHFYQGVIVVLLVFFTFFFVKSHQNYMDLLECNDELLDLLDEQRAQHETIIDKWEESYDELQTKYGKLLVENDTLRRMELPVYDFTEAEIYLIAQCVEAEAGYYENHEVSQQYVTQVILNRLHSNKFPNSVEEVIYERNGNIPQFSVAYNGMMEEHSEVQPETLANVYQVIVHGTDLPEYVCYFYSASVTENWVNTLPIYTEVDGTVFAYENKEDY